MNTLKKIPLTIIYTLLFILIPFLVLTFLTSNTNLIFNTRSFVVMSGSMQPLLPVGSMVYSMPQSAYKVGDIITFKDSNNNNITHRVTKINKEKNKIAYITRGDANNTIDSQPVAPNQVTGRVFFFFPYIGLLVNQLKNPTYFFAFIITPSIIFIILELFNIKNEIVKSTEKRILEKLSKT